MPPAPRLSLRSASKGRFRLEGECLPRLNGEESLREFDGGRTGGGAAATLIVPERQLVEKDTDLKEEQFPEMEEVEPHEWTPLSSDESRARFGTLDSEVLVPLVAAKPEYVAFLDTSCVEESGAAVG